MGRRGWRFALHESALRPRDRICRSPVARDFLRHGDPVGFERALAQYGAAASLDDPDVGGADFKHRRTGNAVRVRWFAPDPIQQAGDETRSSPVGLVDVDGKYTAASEASVGERDRPKLTRPQLGV